MSPPECRVDFIHQLDQSHLHQTSFKKDIVTRALVHPQQSFVGTATGRGIYTTISYFWPEMIVSINWRSVSRVSVSFEQEPFCLRSILGLLVFGNSQIPRSGRRRLVLSRSAMTERSPCRGGPKSGDDGLYCRSLNGDPI